MQIRCSTCTKTIAIAPTGVLPAGCPHCSQAAFPGRLGAYVLDRLIATGGMGEVYLAHHHGNGTEVAIKLLPALPLDVIDSVRERFAREARLSARIEHPGVVRTVGSDASGDRPYLVMELVKGKTLRQVLGDGPIVPGEAARIAAETADVLAAAHGHGVLHRDIKPDNVMVEPDGRVRVLDFGIARALHEDAPLTRTGELVGTPEYMAPEQLLEGPEAIDERTDIHALGVLLYELLTGRSPYRGANLFQSLKLVESLQPKSPCEDLPELSRVALHAIEKDPAARFGTAAELAAAIRAALPCGPPRNRPRKARPWPYRLAVGGSLLGLAGVLVVLLMDRPDPSTYPAMSTQILQASPWDEGVSAPSLSSLLEQGHWCEALALAERASASGSEPAREAFVLSHAAWWRAAGLPPWMAAYDLAQRGRLFGGPAEPGVARSAAIDALWSGDATAWGRFTASMPTRSAAVRLLRTLDPAEKQREELLANYAETLPVDQPEHWLARLIERHLRGDPEGATQAAERAWLSGAGEIAILLDAALAMDTADAPARERIWQRLLPSNRVDCPASTLLLLYLEALGAGNVTFEPQLAQSLPPVHRPSAAGWFLGQARTAEQGRKGPLLRVAAALGAAPDFTIEPWLSLTPAMREAMASEVRRAR